MTTLNLSANNALDIKRATQLILNRIDNSEVGLVLADISRYNSPIALAEAHYKVNGINPSYLHAIKLPSTSTVALLKLIKRPFIELSAEQERIIKDEILCSQESGVLKSKLGELLLFTVQDGKAVLATFTELGKSTIHSRL